MTEPSQRARELLAKSVEDQGPAFKNTANSIRAGFSNFWVGPALSTIDGLLRQLPEDDDD